MCHRRHIQRRTWYNNLALRRASTMCYFIQPPLCPAFAHGSAPIASRKHSMSKDYLLLPTSFDAAAQNTHTHTHATTHTYPNLSRPDPTCLLPSYFLFSRRLKYHWARHLSFFLLLSCILRQLDYEILYIYPLFIFILPRPPLACFGYCSGVAAPSRLHRAYFRRTFAFCSRKSSPPIRSD